MAVTPSISGQDPRHSNAEIEFTRTRNSRTALLWRAFVRAGISQVLYPQGPLAPERALAAKASFGRRGCRSTPNKCILVGPSCHYDQNSRILSGTFQATCVLKGGVVVETGRLDAKRLPR